MTITTIADAIKTELLTLTEVDYASATEFTPPISTQSVACLVVPFGQRGETSALSLSNNQIVGVYRIPVEFWVKHIQGAPGTSMTLVRDIGMKAMKQLLGSSSTAFVVDNDTPFEEDVNDTPVEVGGQPYFISRLLVPVWVQESAT